MYCNYLMPFPDNMFKWTKNLTNIIFNPLRVVITEKNDMKITENE